MSEGEQAAQPADTGEVSLPHDLAPRYHEVGPVARIILLGIGWFFVVVGTIGIFLPVLPTTPFLLISLWAFSRSSHRLHVWLYTHPRAGPYLVAWNRYHVIPPRAKLLAVSVMGSSWLYMTFFVADSWVMPAILGVFMASVTCWILTRRSHPPLDGQPN